ALAVLTAQAAPLPMVEQRTLAALPQSAWFLIHPAVTAGGAAPPGLLVVLPGGDGSQLSLPFVLDRVVAQAPAGFVTALLPAPRCASPSDPAAAARRARRRASPTDCAGCSPATRRWRRSGRRRRRTRCRRCRATTWSRTAASSRATSTG